MSDELCVGLSDVISSFEDQIDVATVERRSVEACVDGMKERERVEKREGVECGGREWIEGVERDVVEGYVQRFVREVEERGLDWLEVVRHEMQRKDGERWLRRMQERGEKMEREASENGKKGQT